MPQKLTPEWFKGKKVTVMGLGIHGGGLGAAKWLLRHGARLTVTDLRTKDILGRSMSALDDARKKESAQQKRAVPAIRYVLGKHDAADFKDADMVIQNPGVPRESAFLKIAKKNGVPIESDTSIFFQLCPFPITAVSGTKGKTTTTTLLAEYCRAFDRRTVVGGNIRISQLDALDSLLVLAKRGAIPPPIVLELSSWQLEGLEAHRRSPQLGVLTNIMEDHLNRYDGMDDYGRAKEILLAFQREVDMAVVSADNARVAAIGRKRSAIKGSVHGGDRFWFSVKPLAKGLDGCFVRDGKIIFRFGRDEETLFPVSAIRLEGRHNVGNVLAATAAAICLGIPLATIRKIIRRFTAVPGRLEEVARKHGVRYVNDTTATAPDAMIAALETLGASRGKKTEKKRIVLIAGGADKALTFGEWARAIKKHVKHLVLLDGTANAKIDAALAKAHIPAPAKKMRSMKDAFADARVHTAKGDTVLLSPGCASFGVFLNEFDRGDQFVALVKRLH